MAVMNPYNYKKPIGANIQSGPAPTIAPKPVAVSKTDAYLEQKIMNARPEELTLMLYEGVVKFITQTKLFNEQKNFEKSNNANLRAQAILQELRSTLNMDIFISENLESLYIFMMDRLVEANMKKDNSLLDEILELAVELKDTWKEAMNL